MAGWIIAVFLSALSWGTADTVFDVIVDSHSDQTEDNESLPTNKVKQKKSACFFFI